MNFMIVFLLSLALSLDGISASAASSQEPLGFLKLPVEIYEQIFEFVDLVLYANVHKAVGNSVSLVTPKFELKRLSGAAGEVGHLDIYDDDQRARLCAILEATRTVIRRHSRLPSTIAPHTAIPTLKDLAAQFQATFLNYACLSSSSTWAKYCMAALLGKDTLVRLLPFLSEDFIDKNLIVMLQAAALIGDSFTLREIFNHSNLSPEVLRVYIEYDAVFSGSVEFIETIVEFMPSFIAITRTLLDTATRLNHRLLFNHLYSKTKDLHLRDQVLSSRLGLVFETVAGRGWEDEFKQLYRDYPRILDTKRCLMEAARYGHTNILQVLLFHDKLKDKARLYLFRAFEQVVGSGNTAAIDLFLGNDERGSLLMPDLYLTQPSPVILERVGTSDRWDGIEHLMELKKRDGRFAEFRLAGDASRAAAIACQRGNLRVLRQLLQKDPQGHFVFAFEDLANPWRDSLRQACYNGHQPIVQELLKHSELKPFFNLLDALIAACEGGDHLVVRELLQDYSVDAGSNSGKLLIAACRGGHLLVVQELLRKQHGEYVYNVDPAADDNEALIIACEDGNHLIVRELLQDSRVITGARSDLARLIACKKGHLHVIQELLQTDRNGQCIHQDIDPTVNGNGNGNGNGNSNSNSNSNGLLQSACKKGHLHIVQELLKMDDKGHYIHEGIDPSADDNEALITACEKGNLLIVRELLHHGCVDPGARDGEPLITACRSGHLSIVQELLQKDHGGEYRYKGVSPGARQNQPLISACGCGHLDIVRFLLQGTSSAAGVIEAYEHTGIDAAAQENKALWEAIALAHYDIVDFLLQTTRSGDYIFPGIALTKQMLYIPASWECPRLQQFLEPQSTAIS